LYPYQVKQSQNGEQNRMSCKETSRSSKNKYSNIEGTFVATYGTIHYMQNGGINSAVQEY
jgi:hypothetical protein